MSADNGVYVLVTPRLSPAGETKEYRVSYHMAVENVYWDDVACEETTNPDIVIANARRMWGKCVVFTDRKLALELAHDIAKDYAILEYGVSEIEIDREF